jgi:RNA polymerase sigma-70 factor, ECF subfamily
VTSLDDDQLVRQSIAGDRDARDALVRRYRPSVHRHLCRYPLTPVERESLTDETMQTIASTLDTCSTSFTTWMYRVTANRALKHLRARRAA